VTAKTADRREAFFKEVARLSDAVYRADPRRIPDHRAEFPGITCCLGDPFAPVWFIAEAPSLTQLQRGQSQSREQQWDTSAGDKLFREKLSEHGFKKGGPFAKGGWRCYITDVIKSSYFVKDWKLQPDKAKLAVAEVWAPVLRYELEAGQPKLVVILGKTITTKPLEHLMRRGLIPPLPQTKTIEHYTYITSRAAGRVGPMDPKRVAAWDAEFAHAAALVR
jgi:hypothetical protein